MQRLTIRLPLDLREKANREAKKLGISLAELIRRRLAKEDLTLEPRTRRFYTFPPWTDAGPSDMAENHNLYLYGP